MKRQAYLYIQEHLIFYIYIPAVLKERIHRYVPTDNTIDILCE